MTTQGDKQKDRRIRKAEVVSSIKTDTPESIIVNLFAISAHNKKEKERTTKPFIHQVCFHGPQGEIIQTHANIDNRAMKEVMVMLVFKKVKHKLRKTLPSSQLLHLANGTIIRSEAK